VYNEDVGKCLNEATVDRLQKLIETSGGEVLVGGLKTINREERYISPTIIKKPRLDSDLMKEEIFGPILPIITFSNFDEVIEIVNNEKPLAIYYAGNHNYRNFKRLCEETSSGNISSNDTLNQILDIELGFGGVGQSGFGRVGGYESFKSFSNAKSIITKWQTNIWPYNYVCPPFNKNKNKIINFLQSLLVIKQNALVKNILQIVIAYTVYMITFGKWGESRFRKEIAALLIKFLDRYK
jgi:aldehyde dehydrogenase (NAD+)